MFIYHFLISNIFVGTSIILVLGLKAVFGYKMTAKANYCIWLPVILLMVFAFLPHIGVSLDTYNTVSKSINGINKAIVDKGNFIESNRDFYISVNNSNILFIVWITGTAINLLIVLFAMVRLQTINKQSFNNTVFKNCCCQLGVRADLYVSQCVKSPMSFGVIKPAVVFPNECFDDNEFKQISLHELIHHKHKDIFANYILCILKSLYWFNPMVYIMIKKIRLDMEIYCDYNVIKCTGDNIDYGNTILNLSEKKRSLQTANYIAGSKSGIKSRIKRIADYNRKYSQLIGRFVLACSIAVIMFFSVVINTYGYTISDTSESINAVYVDYSNFFNGEKGCFVLFDSNKNQYKLYNEDMAVKRVSPNSTYKIAIALNGLEEGVITSLDNEILWNGEKNPFEEWNCNHNLNSAMKNSVNWYFKNIDSNFSSNEISKFLKRINYGNQNIGYDKENYWLENSLKISAVEQVEFLKGVYNNEFDFKGENVNAVINSIKLSNGYYGKTGTGMVDGKIINGWFTGIINKNDNSYIFAVRIEGEDNATGTRARNIAERILKEYI